MLKKTPLKSKNNQLKKTPLKSNSKGLKVHSSLKKSGNLNIVTFTTKKTPLKKTTDLQNKGTIDPTSYSENSWHNTRSMLTEQQS